MLNALERLFKGRSIQPSAVGFAAVADAEDAHGVVVLMEADAVVADSQAELWWVDILEAFDVAGAGFGEALDGLLTRAMPLSRSAMSAKAVSVPLDLHYSSPSLRIASA